MQRRTAGLAAALGLLAFLQPQIASAWVLQGVPARARTEPLNAASRAVRPSTDAAVDADASAFPVRGRHDLGTAVNGFGGGRGHDGQDIFAGCGTRIVAARTGRVVEAATAGNEGNYVVTQSSDGRQQAYLHLLWPSPRHKRDRVGAGEPIGRVGQTGNAEGCHLHFELWTAPGRFTGGRAVNPRPALDRWASEG